MNQKHLIVSVGNRIKKARLNANLSQEELGDRIGRSQQFISHFEKGRRAIRIDLLASIAAVCGVPINYFFIDSDDVWENECLFRSLDNAHRSIVMDLTRALADMHPVKSPKQEQ